MRELVPVGTKGKDEARVSNTKEVFEFEGKRKDTSLVIMRSFQYFCEYRRQLRGSIVKYC